MRMSTTASGDGSLSFDVCVGGRWETNRSSKGRQRKCFPFSQRKKQFACVTTWGAGAPKQQTPEVRFLSKGASLALHSEWCVSTVGSEIPKTKEFSQSSTTKTREAQLIEESTPPTHTRLSRWHRNLRQDLELCEVLRLQILWIVALMRMEKTMIPNPNHRPSAYLVRYRFQIWYESIDVIDCPNMGPKFYSFPEAVLSVIWVPYWNTTPTIPFISLRLLNQKA